MALSRKLLDTFEGHFSHFSLGKKVRGWREGEAAVVLEKIEMKWVHAVERFVWFFFSFLFFFFYSFFFVCISCDDWRVKQKKHDLLLAIDISEFVMKYFSSVILFEKIKPREKNENGSRKEKFTFIILFC